MQRVMMIAAACSLSGCVSLPRLPKDPLSYIVPPPNRMVVTITPNHIERDGLPFHQGLFCRVHFFRNDEPLPLAVDGDIQFVAYDKAKNGDKQIPVGLFQIPASELEKHHRKDFIGESYIFWLPYEPDQPTQMVVTGSFKPTRGEPFSATPSTVHLTPLKMSTSKAAAKPRFHKQYTVVESGRSQASASPTVTNIPLGRMGDGQSRMLPQPQQQQQQQQQPMQRMQPQQQYPQQQQLLLQMQQQIQAQQQMPLQNPAIQQVGTTQPQNMQPAQQGVPLMNQPNLQSGAAPTPGN